jgi:hypothetical protein
MTPEIYAEWLRRQGHRVIRTQSSYWHSSGMGAFQAFPYHWLIDPSKEELSELASRHHALALRYSMSPDGAHNGDSYHAVFIGADYDFSNLGSWGRKNVRRGLRSCTVGPISFDRYVEEGWALRLDTLARQQRRIRESREDWRRKISALTGLDGFEVWAAEVQGRLGATLVVFQMDGWAYMVYQQCHRDFLREHVNNALSFTVTRDLIRRPNTRGIFYGMRSLDAPPTVDEFKFRMGYEAKPVKQRIVFSPYLTPFVNSFSHRLLRTAHKLAPEQRWLAKAEGMFRFALSKTNGGGQVTATEAMELASEPIAASEHR